MRKVSLLTLLCCSFLLWSQAPQGMNYQSIVKNASGDLVSSSPIGLEIQILQGSVSGTIVYEETHNISTNTNGLLTLVIGQGTTSGDFSSIDWANGPFFVKTNTDPDGGTNYSISGTTELLSVPYALYATNGLTDGNVAGDLLF